MYFYVMTALETTQYDSGNDALLDALKEHINTMLVEAGCDYVEVYTIDGIVAWVHDNREQQRNTHMEPLTGEQIVDRLDEIGETGWAKIKNGNELWIQKEVNSGWFFSGTVEDPYSAEKIISQYWE